MPLSKIVAKSITDDTITTDQIADAAVHGRRNLFINGSIVLHKEASLKHAEQWIILQIDGTMQGQEI